MHLTEDTYKNRILYMKNLHTFEEFVNESFKSFKDNDLYDAGENIEEVTESLTFDDVYKAAKKVKGFKGSKKGFEVPYKYGTIDMYPENSKVDITWTSGGSTQDSDTYDISKALKIISDLNKS